MAWDPNKPMGLPDWLGREADEIGSAWGKGDYGYAIGQAAMAALEAPNRGVGWLVGGPIQGTLARVQGDESADILDPTAAEARYETLNPAFRFGLETAAWMALPTKLGAIGKLAGWERSMQATRAVEEAESIAQAVKSAAPPGRLGTAADLVARLKPASTPTQFEKITPSKPTEALRKIPSLVPPAVGLAAGIGTVQHDLAEGKDLPQAVFEGAMAGAATLLVAKGVTSMAGKAKTRLMPDRPLRMDTSGLRPDVGAGIRHIEKNLDTLEGRATPAALAVYPGAGRQPRGMLGPALGRLTDQHGTDVLVTRFLDRFQPFRTWQKQAQAEKQGFVLRQRAEARNTDAWASMSDDEKASAMWREWDRLSPQEKVETVKLEPFQDFVQKATEYTGRGPRVEKYLGRIGVDLNAAGLDIRNKKTLSTFDSLLTLRAIEQRLAQGVDTDVWRAGDPRDVARVQDMLAHARGQIDSLFPAPRGSAKTRSQMWDDAIERMTVHYNAQLDRMVDAGVLTREAADRMISSKEFYIRGSDATHEAFSHILDDRGGWFEQPKQGPTMTAATTGLGITTPSAKPFAASLRQQLEHFAWREGITQKAELSRALASWRQFGGVWAREMQPMLTEEPRPGYGVIPVLERLPMEDPKTGETMEGIIARKYEIPKDLADVLNGMATENVDFVTKVMGRFSGLFRAGVTAYSIPFIFRNVSRDLETVLLLNGLSSVNLKSYMGALFDTATDGKWRDLAAKWGDRFDPIKRMEEAMLSPSTWATGERMTYREEMLTHGAGMGTLAEVVGKGKSVAEMAGLEGGLLAHGPLELIRAGAEILEFSTRGAVYTAARKAGREIPEAVRLAREATVDFSRTGNITRIFNMWAPLLNARMQGTYRTLNALHEDPEGFMLRAMLTIGVPTIATYVHNRENFSDLYDKIGVEAKDSYYPIVFGSYTDRMGDVRPLYFAIPKDAAHKLISAPIEHLLDTIYHSSHGGQELSPEDRTERSMARMLWDGFVAQSPVNFNSSELSDPTTSVGALWKGLWSANPLVGTTTQLISNQDWQRGSIPIADPYEGYVPQRDALDPETSPTAALIAKAIGAIGLWRPAPSQAAFLAKGFGGTAAQSFMGAGDVLAETIGLAPPKPTDWNSLVIPPGTPSQTYERIADQLSRLDMRPWYVKTFPWWFGASGGAQTQAAKVQQMGAKERAHYQDTRNLYAGLGKWQANEWEPAVQETQAGLQDRVTHGEASKAIFDLSKKRLGVIDALKQVYPLAITDPRERKAFHERMPGVPVRLADEAAHLQELEGTLLAEAIRRYDDPPRIAGRADLKANPITLNAARNAELNDLAREWGLDPKDIQDQVLATKRGAKLPFLALPAIYIEEAINRYKYPKGIEKPEDLESADLMRARSEEVKAMAEEWGVPVADLWTRIRARLSFPEERNEMVTSFEVALNLSTESRDAGRFPRYRLANGAQMGESEADWLAWDAELEAAKTRYGTDYNRWPRYYRELDDAKRRGEVARLQFLSESNNYYDYVKWFGVGRDLTEDEFGKLMTGDPDENGKYQWARYKKGTPEDWNQWDYQARLYEAAPRGSVMRRQLAMQVRKHNGWQTRIWRTVMYGERAEAEQAKEPLEEA